MEYCERLAGSEAYEEVIDYVTNRIRRAKTYRLDVVRAYKLFCEKNPEITEEALLRLTRVRFMCRFAEPEVEDIISMLFFSDRLAGRIRPEEFMTTFSEKRYRNYWEHLEDAVAPHPSVTVGNEGSEERVAYYVMSRVCDNMFSRLIRDMNKRMVPNAIVISKAYSMAKGNYGGLLRESGEPYIVHAVHVARFLAEAGVESGVVAAAILHDAVERTECTLDDISRECGNAVARYVDAVTSVHREYWQSLRPSEYGKDKAELDELSFRKLVRTVASNKEMIFALYIKAGEIIRNLQMVDSFSGARIHDLSDEINNCYVPLLRTFKLNLFADRIADLLWRAGDTRRYDKMESNYNAFYDARRLYVEEFRRLLADGIKLDLNAYAQQAELYGFTAEINVRPLMPYDIYKYIGSIGESYDNPSKLIDDNLIPVCYFDIVVSSDDPNATMDSFATCFVKMFEKRMTVTGRVISDIKRESDKRFVFEIEDDHRNSFVCNISMEDDYMMQKLNSDNEYVTEDYADGDLIVGEKIRVQLRNDRVIYLPKGATVIDAAFAIHEEVGIAAIGAEINDKPVTIYNMLQDGDKIKVISDTGRKDGITEGHTDHARISWFKYTVTERARDLLIAHLTNKYGEGDDPNKEFTARTSVVSRVADLVMRENEAFFGRTEASADGTATEN